MASKEARIRRRAATPGRHARGLLAWYDRHRRELPWRAAPGQRADAYRVWLSEVMLQQTTVAAVIPYFERFTARWPDIGALARASLDDVLVAWQGLGYYSRARNLKAAAEMVAERHGGAFPDTEAGLAALPGVGPYSAAAIAAIAFARPATVVDGNVERVIARLFAVETELPGAKPELRALAAELAPAERPGDYAQAMMDLGATVCRPREPLCGACPLAADCAGRAAGDPARLPRRAARKRRPVRRGTAWFCVNARDEVLLRRRPEAGLLGGMMEVPTSDWVEGGRACSAPPVAAAWSRAPSEVVHLFTHFRLELAVACARLEAGAAERFGPGAVWARADDLSLYALPTVMKKVCRAGFDHLGGAV